MGDINYDPYMGGGYGEPPPGGSNRGQCGHYLDEHGLCPICEVCVEKQNTMPPIREASGEDWRSILDEEQDMLDSVAEEGITVALRAKFPYGHERFIDLCLEEMSLHSRKNYDYAFGGNSLGNFTRVANILSNYPGLKLTPPVVALVYAMKQLDAVLWQLSQGYEGTVEGIDDKAQDIHVYVKLFRILLEEHAYD